MCFARLICAQAELQPFEADARAATLNNFLDLASSIQLYIIYIIQFEMHNECYYNRVC